MNRFQLIWLSVALFVLAPLAAFSQNPGPSGPAFTPNCIPRNMDRPCPSAQPHALRTPRPTLVRAGEAESQYEQSPHANPDAPDQSELLKNSKDPDFIRRNFKTMYVVTKDIDFFDAYQMKAALGRNPDFQKLDIRIVDDRRVADTVLIVSYTFAWDYPFELRHQNTTTVLLSGKGEGPFSGPLGAADVARQFVNAAKPWRTTKEQKK